MPLTEGTIKEAWRVVNNIPSNGKVTIHYPHETSIGVFYEERGNTMLTIGPYPATLGTTWMFDRVPTFKWSMKQITLINISNKSSECS